MSGSHRSSRSFFLNPFQSTRSNRPHRRASQLAVGISEALVNTAGGLISGILGIFFYNFFVNKVDAFNYTTDEATFEVMQIIKAKEGI